MVAKRKAQGRMLTAFGQTRCLSDWARLVGITSQALSFRLRNGWPADRALSEGRGKFGPASLKGSALSSLNAARQSRAPDL